MGINKGGAVKKILGMLENVDFIFCVGDDRYRTPPPSSILLLLKILFFHTERMRTCLMHLRTFPMPQHAWWATPLSSPEPSSEFPTPNKS